MIILAPRTQERMDGGNIMVSRLMTLLILLTLIFTLTGIAGAADRPGFVTVRGRDIISPTGEKLYLKGIGLGNWLLPEGYMFHFKKAASPRLINQVFCELVGPDEARLFWNKFIDNYITREDIWLIKKAGFNCIRIPINYRLLNPENLPHVFLDRGYQVLDRTIRWAKDEGLYVILDMHAAPGGQTGENIDDGWGTPWLFESNESRKRAVFVWKDIAEHYKDEPTVLGYELLNEPIPNFPGYEKYNPMLEPLYKEIVAAIREADPDHIIILGGAQWNTNFAVFGPPFDKKLVYTFHHYWSDPSEKSLSKYLDFSKANNAPIWLGESGENTNQWIETYRKSLEKSDVGWCFWPYKKMDATSCVLSFSRPPHWDMIVDYADNYLGADFSEKRKHRPSMEESREALDALLEAVKHQNCRINKDYIEALGL